MRHVHVLVEGQTEERMVELVFQPELVKRDIWITPVILATRRAAGRPHDKGGVGKWTAIEREIRRLLQNTALDMVTTMFDLYGLPADTPGLADAPTGDPYARVCHVEDAMGRGIDHRRFLPFLALHETEAWVLAAAGELSELVQLPGLGDVLRAQVATAGGPERVNDSPRTAPSKRILRDYPRYNKVVDGPDAVDLLGLDALRAVCPHLDTWLNQLEGGADGTTTL
ncbi:MULTISPECIES: DUF4276 family protein [Streptomyces]|uniref:DUF4276 family protein n=2 Tax=Streptomyces bottropensis TaxID=42235 RepID=M3FFU9_9ACTN|nr:MULTISPECIES: DUF4276 family protein [Streptomyces]EMF50874.1 hypothetical protein SBD_7591 [Streptomyces bottropensis ATCC 25435]MZD21207.1 DUF4276 family protein [Streptomyces sp. SID5476]